MNNLYSIVKTGLCLFGLFVSGCNDFVKIDPPRTDLIRETVFSNDATAEAAVVDMYYQMATNGFGSGAINDIGFYASLSCDEFIQYASSSVAEYKQFNENALHPNNPLLARLWTDIYKLIYKANAALEGLANSSELSQQVKDRLTGEAKFLRAFCHFYALNSWGEVPLVLSTSYTLNNSAVRSLQRDVYLQIINDLHDAQRLLPDNYSHSKGERVRANMGAATAMLARAYLYTEDWANAEIEATKVISNSAQYRLEPDLLKVFRGTSQEVILQLWSPVYPNDRSTYSVFSFGPFAGAFRPEFAAQFETGDQRWTVWGRTRTVDGAKYYYTLKYLDFSSPPLDYSTVLRLAEQYLIRAEARIKQNKLPEATSDVNIIRSRAGLTNTSAVTQEALLDAIMQERRSELFTEWGHRWFDLKRTGVAADVLSPIKPGWTAGDVFYPIPEIQLINDSFITQNPN